MVLKTSIFLKLENLFANFKSISVGKSKALPTFLEITGKAHKEDVISNILAFFFRSDQPHGLNDLFLRSFLKCMQLDIPLNSNVYAYREVTTAMGKRIDLIVEADGFVLIIENKINNWLQNDLSEYAAHAMRHYKKKEYFLAVLSMDKIHYCGHGFINVTYQDFISKINTELKNSTVQISEKYLPLLKDFFDTLKNLRSHFMINQEMRAFFIKNQNEIQQLLEEKNLLDQEVRNRAHYLLDLIIIREDIEKLVWSKNVVITQKSFPNNMWLKADCVVDLYGYHFHVFVQRHGNDDTTMGVLNSISYFKDKSEWDTWPIELPFETPIEEVAEKYNEIIQEVFR